MKWTDEQNAVFEAIVNGSGNICGSARAGCTKTSTITEGINRLAKKNPQAKILYIVFNKKNQTEAEEKIILPNVNVRTMHSESLRYIMFNWRGIRGFAGAEYMRCKSLAGEKANKQLIMLACQLVGAAKNRFISPSWQDLMTLANNQGIQPTNGQNYEIDDIVNLADKSIAACLEYPANKQISFDDMIYLPVRNGWFIPTYDFVFLDEAQDANILNFHMVEKVVKPNGRICLIGDEFQQIYGFRGAVKNGMTNFAEKVNAVTLPLTVNFRCGKNIIAKAQELVPDIQAHDNAQDGIVESCNEDKLLADVQVNEAILSRTNAPLIRTCLALIRKGKPAYVEGRDMVKVLTDIIDSLDCKDVSELNTKLDLWLQIRTSKATGFDATRQIENWTDQAETLKVLGEGARSFEDITKKIESLFYDSDYVRVPSVILSTVHKSKGREFPSVYILEKSFVIRGNIIKDEYAEKCIRYVALTRAKSKLVMVC